MTELGVSGSGLLLHLPSIVGSNFRWALVIHD